MTTDLGADLRREFDAATPPSGLTFHPESVLRQGNRTIRRHRIIAAGSAAMAVALVATGASLLTRPHDTALPRPANRTATSGIVRASLESFPLTAQVEVNRDPRVKSNVQFVVVTNKGRVVVGVASTAKPGQRAEAIWKSGMVAGHPFTFGLVPGNDFDVKLVPGASFGFTNTEVKGTGYSAFSIMYKNGNEKEPARPAQIASISWSGPTGIVDGIEGDHRLSGQILKLDSSASVKLVLRPGIGGRTTVSGETRLRTSSGGYSMPQTVATTDGSGVAVVTGRYPVEQRVSTDAAGRQKGWYVGNNGAPIAAGILPPGASNIGVILTAGEPFNPVVVLVRLPDGRVTFAVKAESAHPSVPSKDSIKAVTWTFADGTPGRIPLG
jgi:hypothetical protein